MSYFNGHVIQAFSSHGVFSLVLGEVCIARSNVVGLQFLQAARIKCWGPVGRRAFIPKSVRQVAACVETGSGHLKIAWPVLRAVIMSLLRFYAE
eukprot:6176850-Pleurochrysis_carterae.AAC.2